MITHILEKNRDGVALMACGRLLNYQNSEYIGRYWIRQGVWVNSVTCKQCRKKYRLPETLNASEKSES